MNDLAKETFPDIGSRIHTIRGVPVMLDSDLARLYGVETKSLNKAVKRNPDRFPSDFMFQLSEEEFLRFQNGTSNSRGGRRYLPYVFTEQGGAMLSGVLRSETAVKVNVEVMRAFVFLRKAVISNTPAMESLSARLDANERRRIADQAHNEARFDEIFSRMGEGSVPAAQIFYQGRFWDAKSLLIRLIRRAKRALVVIDAYPGVATLDMLAKRGRGVKIELVTHSDGELMETDFLAFGKQYGHFTKTFCGTCHDRFLVVDEKELYWCGASLKDAGRLTFAVAPMGPEAIPGLMESIRRATSARVEYP